ncbi:hypothetical protein PV708_09445 [Streptomyces sp. ME02-6977A]|uniref:hypothetical protein n=1 Tax=Streptomyces sp. ME02-6977A TaxID=3028671 RepID=UPI0029B3CB42|nr:hypothetical protein [Streptomyces sp. ME02-6977A]MDX3406437.1 hypothetical protein [Streptomyces sp. ME02-6977A]
MVHAAPRGVRQRPRSHHPSRRGHCPLEPAQVRPGPAEGLPLAGEAHCRYLAEWEDLKLRYAPSVDEAEAAALREVADGCRSRP